MQARLALVETEKHTVQQTMEHELSQTEAAQLQLRDELIQLQHDIEVRSVPRDNVALCFHHPHTP